MSEALETLQRHHALWFVLAGAALFAWNRWREWRSPAPRATGQSIGHNPLPVTGGGTAERDGRPTTLVELGAQLAELETRREYLAQQIATLEDQPTSAPCPEAVSVGPGRGERARGRARRSRQTPE